MRAEGGGVKALPFSWFAKKPAKKTEPVGEETTGPVRRGRKKKQRNRPVA
jgi:hypothetical protein